MTNSSNNIRKTIKVSPFAVIAAFNSRQYRRVINLYKHSVGRDKRRPQFLLAVGHSYYELKQYGKAVSLYSKIVAMKLRGEIRQKAYYNRGLALCELDRYAEALKDFKTVGVKYDKSERLMGEMYYRVANGRRRYLLLAKGHLRKWIRRNPDDGYVLYLIGACYNLMDNAPLALRYMQGCLRVGYLTRFVVEGLVNEMSRKQEPEEIAAFFTTVLNNANDSDGRLRSVVDKNVALLAARREDPNVPLPEHLMPK